MIQSTANSPNKEYGVIGYSEFAEDRNAECEVSSIRSAEMLPSE